MDYLFRWLELRFLKGEQAMLFERQSSGEPQYERGSVKALGKVVELGDAHVPVLRFVDGEKRFLLSLPGMRSTSGCS